MKKFNPGDKIVPLKGAEFEYPLKDCILEVENQLFQWKTTADGEVKDTYCHVWRARDYTVKFKFGKRSFAVCSDWFEKLSPEEEASYILDEL